jgi:hypothetical protein
MVTSLKIRILLFFEKLILPTMSKTAKFGFKTEGILGVNTLILQNPIRQLAFFQYLTIHKF